MNMQTYSSWKVFLKLAPFLVLMIVICQVSLSKDSQIEELKTQVLELSNKVNVLQADNNILAERMDVNETDISTCILEQETLKLDVINTINESNIDRDWQITQVNERIDELEIKIIE